MFLEIFLIVVVLLYAFLKWATVNNDVFIKRSVAFEKPTLLFGNLGDVMKGKESFWNIFVKFYRRHKKNKVAGFFNFREPIFMISDPELIKKVMVKDFEYFPNHKTFVNTKKDTILHALLFNMKDQRWKDMRCVMTPAFTTAKMRAMFPLMNECFDECLSYLKKQSINGEGFEVEMKQCFTRLTNDIIASTAFGIKVNSYEDPDNKFYNIGQTVTAFKGRQLLLFTLANLCPRLMDFFGIKIFNEDKIDYFTRLVIDAIKHREENKITRPDMIDLLMEAKRESTQHWTDEEIVAQCFSFFFAAFENNANAICVTCHELMRNPEIQEHLYEEAKEMRNELQGKPLNYDTIAKLKYLDMVVSESMRKLPLNPFVDRVCSKDYQLTDEEGNLVFQFKEGDHIFLPIIGLQRDEEYFANPSVFDPERFNEENRANMNPFTYIPFGAGPRFCIGNRYALMQIKAILYYLVLDYKMEPSPKSAGDLLEEVRGLQLKPPNGFWIKYVPRT